MQNPERTGRFYCKIAARILPIHAADLGAPIAPKETKRLSVSESKSTFVKRESTFYNRKKRNLRAFYLLSQLKALSRNTLAVGCAATLAWEPAAE